MLVFLLVCEAKRSRTGQKRVLSRFSKSGEKESVGRSSGGASDADRDNERADWSASEAEILVPEQINKNGLI